MLEELRRELTKVVPQLDQTLLDIERLLESTRGELEPYVQEAQAEGSGTVEKDA